MPLKIATSLFKGGVGKTTVTVNTAHAAVELLRKTNPEARVLVIDADTQAGATQLLTGRQFKDTDPTISTLMVGSHTLQEVIIPLEHSPDLDDETRAVYAGIDLIPAGFDGKVRVSGPEDFWQLRDMLDDPAAPLPYALIMLDCGYGDSDLNTLALVAADHVIAVTTVTVLGMNGVSQLMEKVAKLRRSFPHVRVSGVIPNDFSKQETADQQMLADMQEQLGPLLWEPPIPRRAIVKRSQIAGLPVSVFKAAPAVRDLVTCYSEIAHRMTDLEESQ